MDGPGGNPEVAQAGLWGEHLLRKKEAWEVQDSSRCKVSIPGIDTDKHLQGGEDIQP